MLINKGTFLIDEEDDFSFLFLEDALDLLFAEVECHPIIIPLDLHEEWNQPLFQLIHLILLFSFNQ